jgi:tight adherence protein C
MHAPDTDPPVSWTDRRLFADPASDRGNRDDAIDPASVPGADSTGMVFGRLTPVLAALFPDTAQRRKDTRQELQSAGYYHPHAATNFAAIRYVAMMLPLLLCGSLLLVVPRSFELPTLFGMVFLVGAGWAVPRVTVRGQAKQRVFRIEQSLPDMIDMLNMCVSQGLTVPDSLRRIGGELETASPDLSRELRIVGEQANVFTLERSLENFADRIDSEEVKSFTSLLIQTERMGTSVTQALMDYADNFRESHRQEADRKANAAAFKLLFPTVLCLMPAVYLFLLGPAVIELSNFLHGEGRQAIDRGQNAVEELNRGQRSEVGDRRSDTLSDLRPPTSGL